MGDAVAVACAVAAVVVLVAAPACPCCGLCGPGATSLTLPPYQTQTHPPKVDFHFISFVEGSDGQVWELDGRKAGPVCHGACGDAGFLKAAVAAIKTAYMDVDPDAQMWNIMAFVKE